ncbi:hypothetical protein [Salinibaculum salinum]|uniref:hypothetical protein n=1 Tax=Salinibaculum salinum TaxID=3131996 RepID=UPI0030EF1609
MAPEVFEKTWERIALLGCLVTAAGSIPVWFTLRIDEGLAALVDEPERITRGGIDGDGVLTLTFAAVVVVALVFATYRTDTGPGWRTSTFTLLSGLGSGVIAVLAYLDVQAIQDRLATYESQGGINGTLAENLSVDVHVALYAVMAGSALVVLAGLVGTVQEIRAEDGPRMVSERGSDGGPE